MPTRRPVAEDAGLLKAGDDAREHLIVNGGDHDAGDGHEEESEAETDDKTFRWDVYLILSMLGVSVLMPWNCVLLACVTACCGSRYCPHDTH